jgi:hypothetical protein
VLSACGAHLSYRVFARTAETPRPNAVRGVSWVPSMAAVADDE